MKTTIEMIISAISSNESATHDFVTTVEDGVVTVIDKNELALPIQLVVSDLAINARIVIAPLEVVPEDERGAFALAVLEANPMINLSDVGIVAGNFVMSGSLSSDSKESVIFQEIETLIYNANEFGASLSNDYFS